MNTEEERKDHAEDKEEKPLGYVQVFMNVMQGLFLFVAIVVLFASNGGVTWILGDAGILYHYEVENRSGEPVVCAVIGWFPRQGTETVIWKPVPNVKGPGHGISLAPGESAKIALTTSDFGSIQGLVRGKNATETRSFGIRHSFVIPPLSECPLASEALLPCFDGQSVILPSR